MKPIIRHSLRAYFASAILAFGMLGLAYTAQAEPIRIVALGASNTAGRGVGRSEAWPAQLEGMLRAKGYDVRVSVSGYLGATSGQVLSAVDSAVQPGTRVVVFDTGSGNDRKKDVPESVQRGHFTQIESRIRALGATPIPANYDGLPRQGDGTHLTAAAHRQVAQRVLPWVVAALHRH
jgi:acyl-CoA thioesterase I